MILSLTPEKFTGKMQIFMHRVKALLLRYFLGLIIEVILIMILITIGLSILNIPFSTALVIGLFAGMMNIIPYIGPLIGTLFGVVLSLAANLQPDMMSQLLPLAGWVILVFLMVQLIDNVLFQPLIYASSVHAHPLEIFFVIMMAGSLAGIAGMMAAIPLYTVLRVFAKEFLNQFSIVRKMTGTL
jgi:predicted PurR-regulated permease PerM